MKFNKSKHFGKHKISKPTQKFWNKKIANKKNAKASRKFFNKDLPKAWNVSSKAVGKTWNAGVKGVGKLVKRAESPFILMAALGLGALVMIEVAK